MAAPAMVEIPNVRWNWQRKFGMMVRLPCRQEILQGYNLREANRSGAALASLSIEVLPGRFPQVSPALVSRL
jgi:hypothetical protein